MCSSTPNALTKIMVPNRHVGFVLRIYAFDKGSLIFLSDWALVNSKMFTTYRKNSRSTYCFIEQNQIKEKKEK